MEKTFTPPLSRPNLTQQFSRFLLFGAILFIAIVSVVLAVVLPGISGENRNKAATTLACAGSVDVGLSLCNEGCSADTHCVTGLICYKSGTAIEGLCRNPLIPSIPTCQTPVPSMSPTPTPTLLPTPTPTVTPTVVPSPTPSPTPTTVACVQACTTSADCAVGKTCVGTNLITGTAGVRVTATRTATATELAALAPDQPISMGPGNNYKFDAKGDMVFTVISRTAGTFFVDMFKVGPGGVQTSFYKRTITIGANQVLTGVVHVPACGGYQIDFGSTLVAGTKYDLNTVSNYFWGTLTNLPCSSGCCQ